MISFMIYCQSADAGHYVPVIKRLKEGVHQLFDGVNVGHSLSDSASSRKPVLGGGNMIGDMLNMDWLTCDRANMYSLGGLMDRAGDVLDMIQIDELLYDLFASLGVDDIIRELGLGNDGMDELRSYDSILSKLGVGDLMSHLGVDSMIDKLKLEGILEGLSLFDNTSGNMPRRPTELDKTLRNLLRDKYVQCELDKLVDRVTLDLDTSGEGPVIDMSQQSNGQVSVILPDDAVDGVVLELTIGGLDGMVIQHTVSAAEAARGVVDIHICPSDGIVVVQANVEGALSAPVRGVIGGYCDTSTGTPTYPPTYPPTTASTFTGPTSGPTTGTTGPTTGTTGPTSGQTTGPTSEPSTVVIVDGRPVLTNWKDRIGQVQVHLQDGVNAGDVLTVTTIDDNSGTMIDMRRTVTPEEAAIGAVIVPLSSSEGPVRVVAEINGGVSDEITVNIPFRTTIDPTNIDQGTIDVELPVGTAIGELIDIIITGVDGKPHIIQHEVTEEELNGGSATVPVTIPPGRTEIVADVDGNRSNMVVLYGGDPTGMLQVPDADDGIITDEENEGGLPASLILPKFAEVGDEVEIMMTYPDGTTDSQSYTLMEEDVGKGALELLLDPLTQSGTHTLTATSGGEPVGEPVALNSAITVGGPAIRIPDNDDGVIDPPENHGGVEAYVEIQYGVEPGDMATVMVQHPSGEVTEVTKQVTRADIEAGEIMMVIPELQVVGEYVVSGKVGDGEYGPEGVMRVDELMDFSLSLSSEDIVDGFVTPETYYKPDHPELHNTIVSDVTIPNVVSPGDTVEVVIGKADGSGTDVVRNIPITEEMIAAGTVHVVMPEIGDDDVYEMKATFSKDGEPVAETNHLMFELDTAVPGDTTGDGISNMAPTLEVPAAADEKFNKEELVAGVEVTVTVPPGTQAGDLVKVEVRDETAAVVAEESAYADGSGQVTMVLDSMRDLDDGPYSISAEVWDAANNKSLPSVPVEGEIVTELNGLHSISIGAIDDGVITVPELKADVPMDIALEGVRAGETLVIEITDEEGTVIPIEHVITEQEAEAGSALLYITELGVAGDHKLVSHIRDRAGNESEKVGLEFVYDDAVPGDTDGDGVSDLNPTITIPDADDDKITAEENADGILVHVDIPEELKKSLNVGDEVLLNIQGPTGDPIPVSHILGQAELDQGYFEHKIDPLTEDGHYSITGVIRDESGGSTDSVAVSFELDTKVPGDTDGDGVPDVKPVIELDDLDNGYINGAANNPHVDATVTVPANTEEGDTILVMISKVGSDEVDVRRFPVDSLAGSTIGVDLPSFPEQGDYEVWTMVEDEVGNISLESDRVTATVDSVTPGDTSNNGVSDTVVTAVMDNTQDDGVLTSEELAQSSDITVTIPENTEPGDTVTVSVTKPDGEVVPLTHTVTQSDIDNGNVGVDASSVIGDDGEYLVSAVIEDEAGNSSIATDTSLGFLYHTNDVVVTNIVNSGDTEAVGGGSASTYGQGDITIGGDLEQGLLEGQQVLIREAGGSWMSTTVYEEDGVWKFAYDDDKSRTSGETVNYEYTIGKEDGLPVDNNDIHQFDVTFTGTTTPEPYVPEFDIVSHKSIAAGETAIIDLDTTEGDDGITYEIVSAKGDCGTVKWGDYNDWDEWAQYLFDQYGDGSLVGHVDDIDEEYPGFIQRRVYGLSGLSHFEVELTIRGTSYHGDPNNAGSWGNLFLVIDGVRYVTWSNVEEVKPITIEAHEGATVTPNSAPIATYSQSYTKYRVVVPWTGEEKARIRVEFTALGDDYFIGPIVPRGGAATGDCQDSDTAKALFDINSSTGELSFKTAPTTRQNYSVMVKATTDLGEVGFRTVSIAVN